MRKIALVCCVLGFAPVRAEEADVAKTVEKAMQAYREGRKQEAVELLQKAAAMIQKENEKGLVAFLPAAPKGWKQEPVQTSSGVWGGGADTFQWTQVEATYREEKGEGEVKITLSSSPTLVESMKPLVEMMKNEQYRQMMNQDPDRKVAPFSRDGWSGMVQHEKGGTASVLAMSGKLMCQIEVPGGDAKLLDRFTGLVDWKGLAGAVR